ncbi:MAG: hypothetical protein B6I20_10105, partial [Bacteroidetes bacterium 4572_117]
MKKYIKKPLLTFWIIISISFLTDAQTHKFSNYTVKDGLSQSNGLCFFQDSESFLWVGTQKGLNKFDKKTGKFIIVEHLAENSLINNNSVYTIIL